LSIVAAYLGLVDTVPVDIGVESRYGGGVRLFRIYSLPGYRAAITECIGADSFAQGCSLASREESSVSTTESTHPHELRSVSNQCRR
jgi:hypothetical protein